MSFTDFITDYGNRVAKQHYLNLIDVFKVDGIISPEEYSLLHKEGRKFGLTDPEIDRLISQKSNEPYHAPYSLEEKFEQLYNVTEMILADDSVSEGEYKLLRKFAVEVGFDDNAIEILKDVLINGVRNHESEEVLFDRFRRELFRR
jgi:uncharacterized tellurite resistance protein B-like protein